MTIVTVLTVTFNSREFLSDFLSSVLATDQRGIQIEIVMVDNGSSDGTVPWVLDHYPSVTVLKNDENNYARALNLGIANSTGDFIVLCNNDATVNPDWLLGLLEVMHTGREIGAVQSKVIFSGTDRINSVGVEETEHFYFRDTGFDEGDSALYSQAGERNYVTGGSVMFRRDCLENVGPWDEDFIMYMEDVDYSIRCRKKGWKLWYAPGSIMYHRYHGSSSPELCEFFCSRNRFFFVAKHFPRDLPACIPTSHFYSKGELDLLYRTLLHAIRKLVACQDTKTVSRVLRGLKKRLPHYFGDVGTRNFFSQLEVLLGLRKIRVGIYDHAGHFAGGGQRYVAEMAAMIQDRYDVTYIFNNDVQLSEYRQWFDIDLDRCDMKIIRIPFFEEKNRYTPDEAMVLGEKNNPFDIIARESLNYDIFINANMLGKVNPLSPVSIFICHFPDQEKQRFFQVDKYDHLVTNSDYTGEWVQKRWGLEPKRKIYPPVHMQHPESTADTKEKLILSVSRFEIGGSKKQLELVQAFRSMCSEHPEQTRGWKLVLAGGSTPANDYLETVEAKASKSGCAIEIRVNVTVDEIKDLYRRASVFWHACGLGTNRPEWVEHFGMTTVEAMQNYCVPIVIDGGGQREIVVHGETGYRFADLKELMEFSLQVMGDQKRRLILAEKAQQRSELFGRNVFQNKVGALFDDVELELTGRDVLPGTANAR